MNNTAFKVGDLVREQFGHVGQVVEVWDEAPLTWYRVMFRTGTRDVFVHALADELTPFQGAHHA